MTEITIKLSNGESYEYVSDLVREDLVFQESQKLRHTSRIAFLLTKHDFKYLRIYNVPKLAFLYIPTIGCYKRFVYEELKIILSCVLSALLDTKYTRNILENVFKELEYSRNSRLGFPKLDRNLIVFDNIVFNTQNRRTYDFSPDFFTTHKLDFSYYADNTLSNSIPVWDKFIDDMADGYGDRKILLRAFLNTIVLSKLDFQVILYIHGPGASGKSILTTVCTALTGENSVITTSLTALQSDQFELSNLGGKKLVLISDTSGILNDPSKIKAYSGQDALRGRNMHTQGTYEVIPEGIMLFVGNQPLEVDDSGNAVERRLRTFSTVRVTDSRVSLIKRGKTVNEPWLGALARELPGIFNWVISQDETEVENYMNNPRKHVKSFEDEYRNSKARLNPVFEWASEELQAIDGKTFVGCFNVDKKHDSLVEGKLLFPTYISYCKRYKLPIVSHRMFSRKLVEACKELGFKNVKKNRTSKAVFITGVGVKDIVQSFEYQIGGELDLSNSDISRNSVVNDSNTQAPEQTTETEKIQLKPTDKSLNREMVPIYVSHLTEKSSLKRSINKNARETDLSKEVIDTLLDKFMAERGLKDPSYSFVKNKRKHFEDCARSVKTKGIAIYKYKGMGISPRIMPEKYSGSINGMNKSFRRTIFKQVGDFLLKEHKMVLLDLDLVSCYTSLLIALYPRKLVRVKMAVDSGSVWESLRKEFIKMGKEELYKKPYVKACFYSVIFSGGSKAMVESILEDIEKGLGVTKAQFEKMEFYETEKAKANVLADAFNLLPMVQEFRAMSQDIAKTYDGETFTGPTGHSYPIVQSEFRKSFANYLQSFELSLLCESTNETLKMFPEAKLLYHFHDGNVIAVKEEQAVDFLKEIKSQMEKTTLKLKLKHSQKIELQASFPKDDKLFEV